MQGLSVYIRCIQLLLMKERIVLLVVLVRRYYFKYKGAGEVFVF